LLPYGAALARAFAAIGTPIASTIGMPKPRRLSINVSRSAKRRAGRTAITETPLRMWVGGGVDVQPGLLDRARALLGRRLARFGTHIERAHVRFEGVSVPRRRADTLCRIKLTVAGRPSVFVEEQAHDADEALAHAAGALARAMTRSVERAGMRTPAATPREPTPAALAEPAPRRRKPAPVGEPVATTPARAPARKSGAGKPRKSTLSRHQRTRKNTPRARASRAQRQRQRSRGGRR
jgi:hypothetical protein